MTTKPVLSIANAKTLVNDCAALFNSCYINIYTGAQPATTLTAEAGTLLSDGCQFGATAFANATNATSDGNATAAANSITNDSNAAGTGTAGHFRIMTGQNSGTVEAQGNCGTSGADLNLNTTSITAGDTIAITSFKIVLQCGDNQS